LLNHYSTSISINKHGRIAALAWRRRGWGREKNGLCIPAEEVEVEVEEEVGVEVAKDLGEDEHEQGPARTAAAAMQLKP
jgi:hypothetical protein